MSILDTKIEFLKGVGPKRSLLLNQELSIFSFQDLLTFFPYRYIDKSKIYNINEIITFDVDIQIIGFVKHKKILGERKKKRLIVSFFDNTGVVDLIFFKRIKWIDKFIKLGTKYLVFGKPQKYGNTCSFIHPEIDVIDKSVNRPLYNLYPVYHSTEKLNVSGLNSKGISKLMLILLSKIESQIIENLSEKIIKKYNFPNRDKALFSIHFPRNRNELTSSIFRLKFEELFFLQISLLKQKKLRKQKFKSFVFNKVGPKFNMFYSNYVPFNLTNAQKRVMEEIRSDFLSGFQMNRLLQGDVGSGKTIIAIMSILLAHDNGYQSCFMAPTEILAVQHFNNILNFSTHINLEVRLLTGKTKSATKKDILLGLKNDKIDLIIGTHSLIEDNVVFSKLGLVVIDEQHKFGVAQRAKLWLNKKTIPHVLVMTATPIPRSLAMTVYGDLDLSVIDELPPNRKSIKTVHKYEKYTNQVLQFLMKQLERGEQAYIVYPLIEESKTLDYKNLLNGYKYVKELFSKTSFDVSMLHGRLSKDEKLSQMKNFLNKKTQILVATTVVEVGVNVPSATIMVIQNAEKFGLSQLHQLRGRVGRGSEQSYCFLITSNKLTNDAKIRLKAMVDSDDGFLIAETDLKLRGPGDILGTRQSGLMHLKIADLIKDQHILQISRVEARNILTVDFDLSNHSHVRIRDFFLKYHAHSLKWGGVS